MAHAMEDIPMTYDRILDEPFAGCNAPLQEPIASCDHCGADMYHGDGIIGLDTLCDECLYQLENKNDSERDG